MVNIISKPRIPGRHNYDVTIEIWEDEHWKGAMNTVEGEVAMNIGGEIIIIKQVYTKWYKPSILEIQRIDGEKIGEIEYKSNCVNFILYGNEFTVYKHNKIKPKKWWHFAKIDGYEIEVRKNSEQVLSFSIDFEWDKNYYWNPLKMLRKKTEHEIEVNTMLPIELLCTWLSVRSFILSDFDND